MMAPRLLLCLALALTPFAADAQDRVVVRTELDPRTVVVGQQARLLVDVYFLNEMPHPPRVGVPAIAGAQVFRFESQATTVNQQIGGSAYVGQRFEFDVYPRRAGNFALPRITVTLLSQDGAATGSAVGPGQQLLAKLPAGFDASQPVIASPEVTLRQRWSSSATKVRVGDAVTRIVTRTAEAVPGSSFGDILAPAPPGVTAYLDPPQIQDRIERGEVTGVRTDRVTYVFDHSGDQTLPGISQKWWNVADGRAETLDRPGLTIAVLAGEPVPSPKGDQGLGPKVILVLAIAACLALLELVVVLRRLRRAKSLSDPSRSEEGAFRQLRKQCRLVKAVEAYRAWRIWTGYRPASRTDRAIRESVAELESAVFGHTAWTRSAAMRLEYAVHDARIGREDRGPRFTRRRKLPSLNPIDDRELS
jgi:BatD DUF11 like domain